MMILMCWFLVGNRIGMGFVKMRSQGCVKHRLAKASSNVQCTSYDVDVDAVRRSSPQCGENGHRPRRSVLISIT